MRILILAFLTILFFSFAAIAQKEKRDANIQFKSQNFPVAADLYQRLIDRDTANLEYAYRLGVSYLYTHKDVEKALHYLAKAEVEMKDDFNYLLEMGLANFYNLKFEEAINYFEQSRNLAKADEEISMINRQLAMIENAKKYYRKPLDVSLVNMGKYINSKMDETTPLVSYDGDALFYTSNEKFDRTFQIYTYDVYYSIGDDGLFEKGKALGAINSMDDEFLAGISAYDGKVMAQVLGYEAFQDIGYTEVNGKGYRGKTFYGENVNSKAIESGAYETVTGDTLFFSSNREGGMGGFDIYYSIKLPTGEWGVPQNIGAPVNTPDNEEFPVLSKNGRILYYASDGELSMGGYDVLKSNMSNDLSFSEPMNLGYPLNDVFDNKTVAFSSNNRYAYVSSVRPDSYGGYDIYRVVFNQEDPLVRILLVQLMLKQGEQKVPVTQYDSVFQISVFNKGGSVFGEYAYNKSKNQATIALPPGSYTLEIEGKNTKLYTKKISIPDEPGINKISRYPVELKLKD